MKKLVLLAVTMGMVVSSVQAQKSFNYAAGPVKSDHRKTIMKSFLEDRTVKGSSNLMNIPVRHPGSVSGLKSSSVVLSKYDISTTTNIYGTQLSEQGNLSYNNDLNILGYVNRKPVGLTTALNSGTIVMRISYDYGVTWDSTLIVANNNSNVNRYPTGTVFNPTGNSTANQAYAVIGAPLLNGTTWNGATLASVRLDAANGNVYNLYNDSNPPVYQNMPRLGMFAGTNGNVYNLSSNYDFNSTATVVPFDGMVVNRGIWNAGTNSFNWDITNIYHPFAHDPSDGSQLFGSLGGQAWSTDGQIGYLVTYGRDSINDHLSMQPIIYHSVDAGATWSLYSTTDFTSLYSTIFAPNPQGFVRPYFTDRNGLDLAVDAYGKLHIFSEVANASSNHPDSLDYGYFNGYLFDTWEQSNGVWNALYVGQLIGEPPIAYDPAAPDPNANQLQWELDWNGRCQICKSPDGYKMGYLWNSTDSTLSAYNEYPNIVGAAADFQDNTYTDPIDFTSGTSYDGGNYWMSVSYAGKMNGSNFAIPLTTARALVPGPSADAGPWMHEFVSGIEFAPSDFIHTITVGINENEASVNAVSIFPNPASDKAMVHLDIKTPQHVSVSLLNTLGQTAKTVDFGVIAGMHTFEVDLKNLSSGLYMVKIMSGNNIENKKLFIQK